MIWFVKLFDFHIFFCFILVEFLTISLLFFFIITSKFLGGINKSIYGLEGKPGLIVFSLHTIAWWFGMVDLFLELHHTGLLNQTLQQVKIWWSENFIKTLIVVFNFIFVLIQMFYFTPSSSIDI